jgi:hypothetical protein
VRKKADPDYVFAFRYECRTVPRVVPTIVTIR